VQAKIQKELKIILQSLVFIFASTLIIQNVLAIFKLSQIKQLIPFESLRNFGLFNLQEVIFLSPIIYFIIRKKFQTKEMFAKKIKVSKAISNIFYAFVLFFCISIFLNLIQQYFNIQIPGFSIQADHLDLFGSDKFTPAIAFISLVLIAPIIEELLFRGFFQTLLRQKLSAQKSIFISSLIFSLIHMEFSIIIPLFILATILGTLYENNKNLWIPITFHIINNGLAFWTELIT